MGRLHRLSRPPGEFEMRRFDQHELARDRALRPGLGRRAVSRLPMSLSCFQALAAAAACDVTAAWGSAINAPVAPSATEG